MSTSSAYTNLKHRRTHNQFGHHELALMHLSILSPNTSQYRKGGDEIGNSTKQMRHLNFCIGHSCYLQTETKPLSIHVGKQGEKVLAVTNAPGAILLAN